MLLLIAWCWCSLAPALGGETFQRYFEELRSRRLFNLAERFCLEKLGEKELSITARIDFAAELARTLMVHATTVPIDQQADLWERAQQVLADAQTKVGTHGRHWALDVQAALLPCVRGETVVWQSALAPDDAALRESGLKFLRAGVEALKPLEAQLRVELRKPIPRNFTGKDQLWPVEVRRLLATVQLELGRALVNQARLSQAPPADRLEFWREAETWVAPLAHGRTTDDVRWSALLLWAECARERGDSEKAQRLLAELEKETLPQSLKDQVTVERVHWMWQQQQEVSAAELLQKAMSGRTPIPGELGLAQIETCLKLWQSAQDRQAVSLAEELWDTIAKLEQRLQAEVPGYWPLRGQLAIDQARELGNYGPELAAALRKARSLYGQQQLEEAAAAYADVQVLAAEQRSIKVLFDAGLIRGSLLIKLERFEEAAQVLQGLVKLAPNAKPAADANILAAYALGRLYDQQPTRQNRENYTNALLEHRTQYPEHPTAGEAAWMLGQLEERRLQNTTALDYYRQVPADHPRAGEAAVASARCYQKVIQRARQLKQPAEPWEQRAIQQLSPFLPAEGTAHTLEQATVALYLAQISLHSLEPDYAQTDGWLAHVIESCRYRLNDKNTPHAEHWMALQQTAQRLRIISLAGQGRTAEAEQFLTGLSQSSPGEVLGILEGLARLLDEASDSARRGVGQLQLRAALELQKHQDQLAPADRPRLQRCQADAFIAVGRPQEAVELYRELVAAAPQDQAKAEEFARLLMKLGAPAQLEEALTVWRKIEGRQTKGSEPWLQTRLEIVRCLFRLDRRGEAAKLIGVTKVLYPKLGNEALQQEYAELERALQ